MALDPVANVFTSYGFAATETDATLDLVTDTSGLLDAAKVLGTAAPAAQHDLVVEEPGPDNASQLGDELELRHFTDPLYADRTPRPSDPVQGFLENCPLIAVLTAMVHVPAIRDVVRHHVARERQGTFSTFRTRRHEEYLQNDPASTKPMKRLPGPASNFEGDRYFNVTFFADALERNVGSGGDIAIRLGGHTVVRAVTPVLYRYAFASPPLHLYYAHSTRSELYPAIVEKAYVYLHSPGGSVHYQQINDGLPVLTTMFELCGYGRQGWIVGAPGETVLPAKRLRAWLSQHGIRPTVLASKTGLADGEPIVGEHAYPVTGYNAKAKTVTVVNVLEEVGSKDRVVTIALAQLATYFFLIVQGPFDYGSAPKKSPDID